jgi:hypothetical protein
MIAASEHILLVPLYDRLIDFETSPLGFRYTGYSFFCRNCPIGIRPTQAHVKIYSSNSVHSFNLADSC